MVVLTCLGTHLGSESQVFDTLPVYQCGSRALSHTAASALAARQPPSLAQRSDASAPHHGCAQPPRRAEQGHVVPSPACRAVPLLPTVPFPAREERSRSRSAEALRALFLAEYRKADRRPSRRSPLFSLPSARPRQRGPQCRGRLPAAQRRAPPAPLGEVPRRLSGSTAIVRMAAPQLGPRALAWQCRLPPEHL